MTKHEEELLSLPRLYVGRGGAVVELRHTLTATHRTATEWRFVGLSPFWFRARTRLDALIDAAHAMMMSGARADFVPVREPR